MRILKKFFVLFVVITMLLQSFAFASLAADENDGIVEEFNAEIMNVKGGASAIVTMTFDDGTLGTASTLLPIMQEYDFKASMMVVPARIESGGSYANYDQLNSLMASGHLEVQSHSYSHIYIAPSGSPDYTEGNNTPENIEQEVRGSFTYLTNMFPNVDSVSFAVPGNSYNNDAMAKVQEVYYAARFNVAPTLSNIQSLNPGESVNAGGWYSLMNIWITDDNTGSVNSYLDACVEKGGWLITSAHEFAEGHNHSILPENYRKILDHVKTYRDNGDVWVASFSEATKYLREYQNSTVRQYSTSDGMFVELTMNAGTEAGKLLPAAIFDMPLTVKVEIPEGWSNVRFRQNGKETYVNSFTEGDKTYAYVDIVPGSDKVMISDGDKEIPKTELNASLTLAKGGANAIATMQFDDGLVPTANLLNQLCEEYGLQASLMLISSYLTKPNQMTAQGWEEIFSKGYLAPESHSTTHARLDGNSTQEEINSEIIDSYNVLNDAFTRPVLTFAVPYSVYPAAAMETLMQTYYAARLGSCVLAESSCRDQMQTLDPEHKAATGGWYDPYMVRLQPNTGYSTTNSVAAILGYLEKCVNNNGWFIGFTHGITPQDGNECTEAQMREIMAAMKSYQDMGMLWVANYTDATIYVRERQNSTVQAYTTYDGMYVDLTMADATPEGLALPSEIFNMPLTVKIEMPPTWGKITYQQGNGEVVTAYCQKENGVNFVLIDLVPNGGTAVIKNEGDPTEYLSTLDIQQNVSADTELSYNIYIPANTKINAVYNDNNKLIGSKMSNGYTKYTVKDINVTDVSEDIKFTFKFTTASGYSDYDFTRSVTSYFDDLVQTPEVATRDKQIAYDFLVFAKATVAKFAEAGTSTADIDAVLAKLSGFTASSENAEPCELGTVANVLTGAAFAINEKPYYVFYIQEGFTGKVTFKYLDNKSVEYNVVNGYYHCERYLILEIANVYELAEVLTITAEGTVGESAITASGAYSLADYINGLTVNGVAPEYESALYSYVISAKNYNNG